MATIITNDFRKELIDGVLADFNDSATKYYIALAKTDEWDSSDTAPTAVNTLREERKFRNGMQGAKIVSDASFVIPRVNWSSGTTYTAFSDNSVGYPTNAYYVMTSNNAVYMCVRQGRNAAGVSVASSVEPTGELNRPFETADGYVWKFLYTFSVSTANKFLSSNYLPIRYIVSTDSSSTSEIITQKSIQDAATPGQVLGIALTAGGTGYTSVPTVSIVGDGDSCLATAKVSGGAVVELLIDSTGTGAGIFAYGSGYTSANIAISGGGGSGATGRAILGPVSGIGSDPRDDLKATYIMFNTKPSGSETGNLVINNDFRQVGLVRNPLDTFGAAVNSTAASALDALRFTTTVSFGYDELITGGTSGAKGYVNWVDSSVVYYHQNENIGFKPFIGSESITGNAGGSGTLTSADSVDVAPAIDKFSGQVLTIENLAPIDRAADQTEDIKIILKL